MSLECVVAPFAHVRIDRVHPGLFVTDSPVFAVWILVAEDCFGSFRTRM